MFGDINKKCSSVQSLLKWLGVPRSLCSQCSFVNNKTYVCCILQYHPSVQVRNLLHRIEPQRVLGMCRIMERHKPMSLNQTEVNGRIRFSTPLKMRSWVWHAEEQYYFKNNDLCGTYKDVQRAAGRAGDSTMLALCHSCVWVVEESGQQFLSL